MYFLCFPIKFVYTLKHLGTGTGAIDIVSLTSTYAPL